MLRPKEHQETMDGILGGSRIRLDVAVKTNSTPIGIQIPTIQFIVSVSPTELLPAHETVSVLKNLIDMSDLRLRIPIRWGHAVAQLVETLLYKSEDRGFGCQMCH
jgi:hypothetical protein